MSDEKDSSARNAGGDARAVVVAAWPTTSSEPRVARASFSSPLSPASELSDSECVTSSEEDDIVTMRTGCPPGLGNARGVSSRRATAASPGARASRGLGETSAIGEFAPAAGPGDPVDRPAPRGLPWPLTTNLE